MFNTIRTSHRATISMTFEEGDLFANSDATLEVRSIKSDKVLGYIDSDFFELNRYVRTANGGESVFYVCPFIRK